MEKNRGNVNIGDDERDVIQIRAAKPQYDEGLVYARLLDETAEGFFSAMLGKSAYHMIANAFIHKNNEYSHKNTAFAVYQHQIVGMASGYSARDKVGFQKNIITHVLPKEKLRVRLFTLLGKQLSRKLGPGDMGDFYLQAIIVDKSMRGKGLGKRLMEYMEQIALEKGANRLSLHVSGKNAQAKKLYRQQGMIVDSLWPSSPVLPKLFTGMTKRLKGSEVTMVERYI